MDGTIHLFKQLPQVDGPPASVGTQRHAPSVRSQPLVGLIRNPRSHGNAGRAIHADLSDNVLVETPWKRSELTAILLRFAEAQVDFIAIDGGDGTVRDVLTLGAGIFASSWPTLIILPTGKTNALGHDLAIPGNWTIDQALQAANTGSITMRQPILVSQRDDARSQVLGFVLGAGAFTRAIALGQRGHELGAFGNAVVLLTIGWSVLQAFFGRTGNQWRRGTRMAVRDGRGRQLAHRGGLPEDERYLFFASSLQTFPWVLDPFRGISQTVRVAVLDNPSRGLLLRLGALFTGRASPATMARGYHVFGAEEIEIDLDEAFILDGEAFPAGQYRLSAGPRLRFVVP